tara:strand:- start:8903 stop:9796 length:894 start_codon:yes stop_codon:yes gene_type:complete
MNPLIQQFIDSKRIDHRASKNTLDSYLSDLLQFHNHIKKDLIDVDKKDLSLWIEFLQKQNLKNRSIARKISTVRQFYQFCIREEKIDSHPGAEIQLPSSPQNLPKSLSIDQMSVFLKTIQDGFPYKNSKKIFLQQRDLTMVVLLYATGIRISELLQLETTDINLKEGYLRVTGKGQKQRVTPYGAFAATLLEEYLSVTRPSLNPRSEKIFINHLGRTLSRQAFWKWLKTMGKLCGIPQISPHLLRHTFATHLLQSGMNLRSLQMLLGHSDLSTTQIYTQLSPSHLKEAHQKFHPKGE